MCTLPRVIASATVEYSAFDLYVTKEIYFMVSYISVRIFVYVIYVNFIISKTKVLLPQAIVAIADFVYLCSSVLLIPKF